MNLMDFPSTNSSVTYKTGLSFNSLAYLLNTTLFITGFPLINSRETALKSELVYLKGEEKKKKTEEKSKRKIMQFFSHSLYNMNSISYL